MADGSQLVFFSTSSFEETVIRPSPFSQRNSSSAQKGVSPFFAYSLIAVTALILGGGLVFWLKSDLGTGLSVNADSTNSIKSDLGQPLGTNNSLNAEKDALERERQRLADERRKLEAQKTQNSVASNSLLPPTLGSWFVVLGSYPKTQPERADQRLRLVQSSGHQAAIIDTDNYPGFRAGYYSVVLGPFSKGDAKQLLLTLKPSIPDAYIKSGN